MNEKPLQQDLQQLAQYAGKLGLPGNTLLVTGATGLIGSLTVKACIAYNRTHDSKISVVALARSREKVQSIYGQEMSAQGSIPQVTFLYQDVCGEIPKHITCDYIIHTANATASRYFLTNPVEVLDSIYTGTARILAFAEKCKVKSMVYLSSMEVFGRVEREDRLSEEELGYLDLQNVRSCYSEGKRAAECLCKCYAQEYGVPVRVARLAQTFGAGVLPTENRVFAQFARSAVKGEDIVLHTRGQSVGNYCYTADAVRAIFLLLTKGEPGEAYTVVNENTTMTIAQMAQLVAQEFSGGRSKVVFDIPEENRFGYAPDTKMRLSSAKLRALGWKPQYGLTEIYERMIQDMENGWE